MKTINPTKTSGRTITTAPGGAELEHEVFCVPRPHAKELRIESFRAERSDDGGNVLSHPLVTRCVECGAQVVEEQDVA